MAGTELVVPGEKSTFMALRMPEQELRDIIQTNIGGADIDASMLDRVKMPSGGMTKWMVPTIEGEEVVDTIEGVVIHWGTRRVYFDSAYGEGEAGAPPVCSSEDGFIGHGEPGGECANCPLNEYGTAPKPGGGVGRGKACTELRQLFVLQPDSIIPIVINVTPGSLRQMSQYFIRLLRTGVKTTAVVTKLSLEKVENKDGIKFAKVVPSAGARLDPEAAARIESLAQQLAPVFERNVTNIDHADIQGSAVEE